MDTRSRSELTRDDANAWLARFAPLVMPSDVPLDAPRLKERLYLVERLRGEAPELQTRLADVIAGDGITLRETFSSAVLQLDSLEDDIRTQIGRQRPGDPDGMVDLEALRDRLSEREARQELGAPTTLEQPDVLELMGNPGGAAGALLMTIFGVGWLAFTTVHMIFMIGGMWAAFGPVALALILFYAIFFAVGFGMLGTAFRQGSREEVRLDRDRLTITRRLWGITKRVEREIDASVDASLADVAVRTANSNRSASQEALALVDRKGKQITFGETMADPLRKQALQKINAYLQGHR